MAERDRERLEKALVGHFAAQRAAGAPEGVDRLVSAMVAEDARTRCLEGRRIGQVEFVVAQLRFIPAWTWVAQAALAALMVAVASSEIGLTVARLAIGTLSTTTVLVGVPTMHASRLHRVAELEYACPNNATSVMVARLVALGCSSCAAVAVMVAMTAARLDVDVISVALWACPPFFLSGAATLAVMRRATPASAPAICVVITTSCCAALAVLAVTFPHLYDQASLSTWAFAAAAALAWLVGEAARTLRSASAGLDAFSPHMAQTHN